MTWFKLDDNFPDNPKVAAVSDAAFRLYVTAGCYASRLETDGQIPAAIVPRLTEHRKPTVLVTELVKEGLWHDLGALYEIHDFLEYNPSREQVRSKRDSKRIAGAMGAAKRWASQTDSSSHDRRNAPDPTRPIDQEHSVKPAARPFDAEFDAWWSDYPRKIDRKGALNAFTARRREGITLEALTRARDNYRPTVAGTEQRFIKHGKSFLAKDGPWSEYVDGPPELAPMVFSPALESKFEPVQAPICKNCANQGRYFKGDTLTECKVHRYA